MSTLIIRSMTADDVETVYTIEQRVMSSPWSVSSFEGCFEPPYINLVAEQGGSIAGYIISSIIFDECQLLKIAVDRIYQRQGIAQQLLKTLLEESFKTTWLEVVASNEAAIAFYKKNGFEKISVRKNYYVTASGHEDAWVMCR